MGGKLGRIQDSSGELLTADWWLKDVLRWPNNRLMFRCAIVGLLVRRDT